MSNAIRALTVVLEDDFSEDDIPLLAEALRQFRGVSKVERMAVDPPGPVAMARARSEIMQKLFALLEAD